jgi:uncharacterized protein (DUF362 family)/Pyruvate/2-oxoacid:ferredoxin oxidoreductase delta subunit
MSQAAAHEPAVVAHVTAAHGPGLGDSLTRLVAPFGGWGGIVAPGERVAVKVNLLRAAPPEKAVTTHPETLRAVLRALMAAGARPFVADSPGGRNVAAKVARAYKISGMTDVCTAEGVQIVDVEDDVVMLKAPEGRLYRSFPVGRAFVEADAVVQVGPLKTHQLMRLTGGVKLTYGCVAGLTKAQLHVRAHRREDFADMLLDLHLALRPRFTVIDALIAMEGQGPGSGTPRELGSLLAARDAVALDAALADRVGFERRSLWVLAAAERRGVIDLSRPYTLHGDPIQPARDFVPAARDTQEASWVPQAFHRFARDRVSARPRLVAPDACTRCADCATICGASAITLDPLPRFDDKLCVRCYACTEICPTAAIDNVSPALARFFTPSL